MFSYVKGLAARYSKFWLNFSKLGRPENLFLFDFSKNWWSIFLRKKAMFIFILSGRVFSRIVTTLVPVLIALAINSKRYSPLFLLFAVWAIVEIYRYTANIYLSKFIASIMSGLKYSAYKYFLTVDPICHAKKSTGEVFGKMERGAEAYEKLIDSCVNDILPTIIGVVTVVFSFFAKDIKLGFLAFIFLLIICFFNSAVILFNAMAFDTKVIRADDDVKRSSIESLIQIQLVRSSFATNEVNNEIENKSIGFLAAEGTFYISLHTLSFITRILYIFFVCALGLYVTYLVVNDQISALLGVSFLTTYIHGTYDTIKIGHRIQQTVRSVIRIKDLFNFIKVFGKKTFPVLKDDPSKDYELPTEDIISLQARNLYFAYKDIAIFRGHNLDFVVPQAQKNKLYGIIGPSGAGKTTFISILGGQIKPYIGNIEINNIPIYQVNDNLRRNLISIQGQSASNLSGSLRDNLLLGIPKNISLFQDDYIIEVLKRTGMWEFFKDKEGLDSVVGEGGLNLSLGQRQRLNFASLYIRTKYYDPLLVLIDEPTSSLDEVSEQSITDMIHEIAKNSLVFVIAHRLRTLDDAIAILDFSLLGQDKNIVFYSREELEVKSEFYQKLICGEVAIEE